MAVLADVGVLSWPQAAAAAIRRLAAVTAAGALLGVLVGGVGGRLAMLLLARLNPDASGVVSDDGFVMGRFTLAGSLNLLLVAGALGVLGAAIYLVLRPLLIGPRWFQVLAISLGPAVVVGEQLVHVDGVDFTLLEPVWLAIALFLLIPGVYTALLTLLAERWLAPGSAFWRGPLWLAALPLLAFGPLAPLLAPLAAGWLASEAVRRRNGGRIPAASVLAWAGRAALAVLFVVVGSRLLDEVQLLV
ncbi:hypothetical protein NODU109028_10355 [Nocardioides dubius]|uniref:Uncharacterized protein n=1 Tax=Nocardioides dubius TaxID=317019 RepID=A0ABP4EHR6_9ACTN